MDVAVFCYNRPDKLKLCLASINLAYVDRLWLFCDGPKRKEHEQAVRETVEIAKQFAFENKVITLRERNYSTPRNVIAGLDQVFEHTKSCLILEDDCIVNNAAYAYIDWALNLFKNDKRIFSINTMSPLPGLLNSLSSYFIPDDIIACNRVYTFWGWATWADRWKKFRNNLEPFKNPYGSASRVPVNCGQHVQETLRLYEEGKVGGWDARLLVLTMHEGLLHIHPKYSLMRNIGLDGTGLHFKGVQHSINDANKLFFSKKLPSFNSQYEHIVENQLVTFLGYLYTLSIVTRSYLLAAIPSQLKITVRKYLMYGKKRSSQF